VHFETVLYDRGGVTFDLSVIGTWLAQKEGSYELDVLVEKLTDPFISTMPKMSSVAPYLTAYRKGVIWSEPNLGFAATDNVTVGGKTLPGFYVPRKNPLLATASNNHLMEMHGQLNELLATIANLQTDDIKELRDHYMNYPIYIALVGGATMVPQYMFENPDTPIDDPMGIYYFGYGTPSGRTTRFQSAHSQ